MKTKNILRTFFAVIFVLGAMAMNAQTKFYVHNNDGTATGYNIDDVKRISVNDPSVGGPNLLLNPGFELPVAVVPADNPADLNAKPDNWEFVTVDWYKEYYNEDPLLGGAPLVLNDGNIRADDGWIKTNTGSVYNTFKAAVEGGIFTARIRAGKSGGLYQEVKVEQGETYEYGCKIGFRVDTNSQSIKDYESIKILYPTDDPLEGQLIGETPIVTTGKGTEISTNTWVYTIGLVKGTVKIPDGVTKVRFQVNQKGKASPETGPVMIWDDCFFNLAPVE